MFPSLSLLPENISTRPVCISAMCTAKTPLSSGMKPGPAGLGMASFEPGVFVGLAVASAAVRSALRQRPNRAGSPSGMAGHSGGATVTARDGCPCTVAVLDANAADIVSGNVFTIQPRCNGARIEQASNSMIPRPAPTDTPVPRAQPMNGFTRFRPGFRSRAPGATPLGPPEIARSAVQVPQPSGTPTTTRGAPRPAARST